MKEPAYDLEAEQAVLAAFLIDEGTWARIGEIFSPEPFYLPAHRAIAETIIRRRAKTEPTDPVLLRGDLLDAGEPAAADLVISLAGSIGTAFNVSSYWQRLLHLSERRDGHIQRSGPALSIASALAKEVAALEGGSKPISSGWPRLDRVLGGGFAVPSLNILGAAPKSGKSTWAQIVTERHVESGGFAYYLDLENGRRRFMRRLLCRRSRLGSAQVTAALRGERVGDFGAAEENARWQEAKRWVENTLGPRWLVEFTAPRDLSLRVANVRVKAADRPLLVVIDSLQKLPMSLEDRRAGVDTWIRLLERLRHEHDAAVLLVSEIKRDQRGQYTTHEAAFKESGGIEYAADLAMTLTRSTAFDASFALCVELARDCDDDPRGVVAAYRSV